MSDVALVVIAKAPVPGRVKTRLCPPCTPTQAATLAAAALADTLRAVAATPARRRLLALDGEWAAPGFEVVPQVGGGLGDRLSAALAAAGGPALVVGMDTPQLTPALLSHASDRLADADAVLGPALDGGYWTIGLREPDPTVFTGVPMSSSLTCAAQRRRLDRLGLRVASLPALRDVDTIEDARAVARECRGGAFAAAVASADATDDQEAVAESTGGRALQPPDRVRQRRAAKPSAGHQLAPAAGQPVVDERGPARRQGR
jgi:rSAM/selenodomain-associated transferase 1